MTDSNSPIVKIVKDPNVVCTDPSSLQYCLKISDTEYMFCEPDYASFIDDLDTISFVNYLTPKHIKTMNVSHMFFETKYWKYGTVDTESITNNDIMSIADTYGYKKLDLMVDNALLAECYFETNINDF